MPTTGRPSAIFERGDISGREFVETFYRLDRRTERHVAEGKQLGLTMDEIVLHDAMWGLRHRPSTPDLTVLAQAEGSPAATARPLTSGATRASKPMRPRC